MAGYWTDTFTYLDAAIRYEDLAIVVLIDDTLAQMKIPCTAVLQWEPEGWGDCGQMDWLTAGMALAYHPFEQVIIVGSNGEVFAVGGGDEHQEHFEARAPIRGVCGVDKLIYAVGMDRQVFRREDANIWVPFDKGIPKNTQGISGFEAIDGRSESELYAVGWDGEIWFFNGDSWAQHVSPVNQLLLDVCCAEDGYTYASGRIGLLIRGKDGVWETLPQQDFSESLWSLASYGGKLYAASYEGIYTLEDDLLLHPVDFGEDNPATFSKVISSPHFLWSLGPKDVMAYDGETWTRVD